MGNDSKPGEIIDDGESREIKLVQSENKTKQESTIIDGNRQKTWQEAFEQGHLNDQHPSEVQGLPVVQSSFGIDFGDGQILTVKGLEKKSELSEGSINENFDDSLTSSTLLAIEAKNNRALEPVSLFRKHADSLVDGPEKKNLVELCRKQAKEISPTLNAWYESKEIQEKIDKAQSAIIKTACDRFGKESIENIKLDKNNMGQAVVLLLFGPEVFAHLGKDNATKLGRNLIVFGLAPVLGVSEEAQKKFQDNPNKLLQDGTTNFVSGTALGVILEAVNPIVLTVVSTACLGILAKQAIDEFTLPENKTRNQKLVKLANSLNNVEDLEMIVAGRQVKDMLAPKLYEIGFDLATGGIAIGGGQALKHELSDVTNRFDITKFFNELGDDITKELKSLFTNVDEQFNNSLKPACTLADGMLHGSVSKIEEISKDDLASLMVDSNDFLGRLGKQIKDFLQDSQRKQSVEKLKLLDVKEAAEIAAKELIAKPPKLDERTIKKIFGPEIDTKEYLHRMSEHVTFGRKVLLESIPPEDILDLHKNGYLIDFADLAVTAKNKLGQSAELPGTEIKVEQLSGSTFPGDLVIHVPLRIYSEKQQRWIYRTEDQHVGLNGNFYPKRLDGVIRHEIAQALSDFRNWKYRPGELPTGGIGTCQNLYASQLKVLEVEQKQLYRTIDKLSGELRRIGYSASQIESNGEIFALKAKFEFCNNYTNPKTGIEQVMTDLYSVKYGGSAASKAYQQKLTTTFQAMYEFLEHNNWFRGDD